MTATAKQPPPAPGPRGHFLFGHLRERRADPLRLYMDGVLEYGDVVRYRMGPLRLFLLNDPAHIKHVLQDNQKNYVKGRTYEVLHPVLGDGLLTSEGEFWRRQRKLAQPAFHRQRLESFANVMTQATQAMLDSWSAQSGAEPLDVAAEMMKLTLGIVGRTLLSADVSHDAGDVGQALGRLLAETNRRLLSFVPGMCAGLPTPRNRRYTRDLKTLNDVVFRIITERRAGKGPAGEKGDLLSMLMEARDEETGESMDDRQLRDEVMTIFLAGHETTANTLAWTLYLLSRNPAVERKLRLEIDEVLGDRQPCFADVPKLRYTAMVLEEALRLYPPAWVIARQALQDDEVGGYRIPAHAIIIICPYVTHRSPKLWENPEGFDPERFTPEASAGRLKYAYFPFGGGPRQCIGNNFAMMEAQIILAMTVRRYRLELVPETRVQPEPLITLRPKGGLPMYVRSRIQKERRPGLVTPDTAGPALAP